MAILNLHRLEIDLEAAFARKWFDKLGRDLASNNADSSLLVQVFDAELENEQARRAIRRSYFEELLIISDDSSDNPFSL